MVTPAIIILEQSMREHVIDISAHEKICKRLNENAKAQNDLHDSMVRRLESIKEGIQELEHADKYATGQTVVAPVDPRGM